MLKAVQGALDQKGDQASTVDWASLRNKPLANRGQGIGNEGNLLCASQIMAVWEGAFGMDAVGNCTVGAANGDVVTDCISRQTNLSNIEVADPLSIEGALLVSSNLISVVDDTLTFQHRRLAVKGSNISNPNSNITVVGTQFTYGPTYFASRGEDRSILCQCIP